MELVLPLVFVVGIIGYFLGWKYTLTWLLLCWLAGALIIPEFYKGGCDGGLCAAWIVIMPFVWLGIGLVLLLIKALSKPAKNTAALPDSPTPPAESQQ